MGLWVPMVLLETHRFTVQVQVKPTRHTGFAGTGVGWTLPTCTIPVCHPDAQTVLVASLQSMMEAGIMTITADNQNCIAKIY